MKINGSPIKPPEPLVIVIPREEGDLVLHAGAVIVQDEFDKLCPVPKPPTITKAGESVGKPDFDDKDYVKQLEAHNSRYFAWLVVKSLSATPGLEWDKVDPKDPASWNLVYEELERSGLTKVERNHVLAKVMEANALGDRHFEEARKRFLLRRAAQSRG